MFCVLNRTVARWTLFEKPADYESFVRALNETWQFVAIPIPIFAMAGGPVTAFWRLRCEAARGLNLTRGSRVAGCICRQIGYQRERRSAAGVLRLANPSRPGSRCHSVHLSPPPHLRRRGRTVDHHRSRHAPVDPLRSPRLRRLPGRRHPLRTPRRQIPRRSQRLHRPRNARPRRPPPLPAASAAPSSATKPSASSNHSPPHFPHPQRPDCPTNSPSLIQSIPSPFAPKRMRWWRMEHRPQQKAAESRTTEEAVDFNLSPLGHWWPEGIFLLPGAHRPSWPQVHSLRFAGTARIRQCAASASPPCSGSVNADPLAPIGQGRSGSPIPRELLLAARLRDDHQFDLHARNGGFWRSTRWTRSISRPTSRCSFRRPFFG